MKMKHGFRIKLAATAFALAGMFSGSSVASAGVLSGMGEINLYVSGSETTVATCTKTTTTKSSDLTLGYISIYDQIQAMTRSEKAGGDYIDSNPWTVCYENSTTYMGQYVSTETFVGQRIKLKAKKADFASRTYTADFTSWDYR